MPFTKEELLATLDPVTFEGYEPRLMRNPVTFDDAFDVLLELGRRETPAFYLSPDEIQAYRRALEDVSTLKAQSGHSVPNLVDNLCGGVVSRQSALIRFA